MEYREVALESMLLDPLNPRHDPVESQREAIAVLLEPKSAAQLLRLATHIAQYGPSPIELALVVPEGKLFVVVEGNRRVAAMKLLKNPSLADRSKIKDTIYDLSKRATAIDYVACMVSDSREEARRWIELRHNGNQQGVGVVGWSPEMQVRFTGIYSGQRGRALRLADALEVAYADDTELLDLLQSVKSTKLTTLGRLISDPNFRSGAGLEIGKHEIRSHFSPAAMRSFWHRLLTDLATTLTVSSLKSKDQRADYLGTLEAARPSEEKRRQSSTPFAEGADEADGPDEDEAQEGASPADTQEDAPAKRTRQTQRPRPMRLFYGLQLKNSSAKARDILREAQRIDLALFPNAAAVLIRVLLELVVGEAIERYQKTSVGEGLRERINACLAELDPSNKADKYLAVRRGVSDRNSLFAVRSIQGYLHNPLLHPDAASLRALSDNYSTLIKDLDDMLGSTTP